MYATGSDASPSYEHLAKGQAVDHRPIFPEALDSLTEAHAIVSDITNALTGIEMRLFGAQPQPADTANGARSVPEGRANELTALTRALIDRLRDISRLANSLDNRL